MKTMILAAAAVLALGVGSAYAADGGEGETAVGLAWAAMNGQQTVPASVAQADHNSAGQVQVAGPAKSLPPAFSTYQNNGEG